MVFCEIREPETIETSKLPLLPQTKSVELQRICFHSKPSNTAKCICKLSTSAFFKILLINLFFSITGLFAALCIHVINIRTTDGVNKRLAENRAQICLLGLHEIQKYWRVNNLVLDFFFQYLDDSTARILLAADTERQGFGKSSTASSARHPDTLTESERGLTVPQTAAQITPQENPMPFPSSTADAPGPPEDQYWNFVRMNREGDENNPANSDLGFLWDAQLYANLDFLEKCI
jgi:hypothetical protein